MNKVVLLAPTPPPAGGIAAWTERMLEANMNNEWKVEVVDEKFTENETFGDGSKRKIMSEIKRTLRIFKDLFRKLRDKQVKVVHSCIPSTTFAMIREFFCLMMTHFFKRRFIIHFRCTVPITTNSRFGIFILKVLVKKSDYIIVLNTSSKDFICNMCNTPCEIIPNFINDNEIVNSKVIKEDITRVVYVGGVIESKGCLNICKIANENRSIEFRMIGQPEKEIIEYSNNIDNVIITGAMRKDEVKKELLEADIFIFLSYFRSEGFSNALAEAMGYGLPCIVTNWAANVDMIESHGGIVVPTKDYKMACQALSDMKDSNVREIMSKWNIEKSKKYYSSNIVTRRYIKIYDKLSK